MKTFLRFRIFGSLALTLQLLAFGLTQTTARADLEALHHSFVSPPSSVKPGCYWWWLDGRINKAAITRDLEAFAAKGIGEVLLVNSANLKPSADAVEAVKFLSPEWRELYRFALRE